jgi:hypothetical protein
MAPGLAFWILMLLWFVFSLWTGWPNHIVTAGNLILFLLFLILGWHVFGAPLKGG